MELSCIFQVEVCSDINSGRLDRISPRTYSTTMETDAVRPAKSAAVPIGQVIKEGKAVLAAGVSTNKVFYNPIQEFNRDLRYIIMWSCVGLIDCLSLTVLFGTVRLIDWSATCHSAISFLSQLTAAWCCRCFLRNTNALWRKRRQRGQAYRRMPEMVHHR